MTQPDECAIGAVRVFGPTGELLRTISVDTLRARKSPVPETRPPDPVRRSVPVPNVPMRKASRREERW